MYPLIDGTVLLNIVVAHALGPFSFCQDADSPVIKDVCLTDQFSSPMLLSRHLLDTPESL